MKDTTKANILLEILRLYTRTAVAFGMGRKQIIELFNALMQNESLPDAEIQAAILWEAVKDIANGSDGKGIYSAEGMIGRAKEAMADVMQREIEKHAS